MKRRLYECVVRLSHYQEGIGFVPLEVTKHILADTELDAEQRIATLTRTLYEQVFPGANLRAELVAIRPAGRVGDHVPCFSI